MSDEIKNEEARTEDAADTAPEAAGEGEKKPGDKRERSGRMELYDWIQCFVGALVVGIVIFMFGIRVVNVKGHSMVPTLLNSDRIVTSDLFYTPKAGDIVVLQTDTYGPEPLVKRIIATAGQTVDIDFEKGVVYVDGAALDEPYVAAPTTTREDFQGPVTVPEGCLFLMGDNRNESTDSRRATIGMVDKRCVIGKVLFVILPAAGPDGSRDLGRLGSVYG